MNYIYRTIDESQDLIKKEDKLALKLNEIGFVTCPQCMKKLVRIFTPRSGRKPTFHGDVQDYIYRMRKTMKVCENRGAKSECHISGPEYTLVYNSNHFTKPYSDNLGAGLGYGHCGIGVYLGSSAVNIVARLFLKHHLIRQACIANGVMPDEVRSFFKTLNVQDLGKLLGYGFTLNKIDNTKLWAGTYQYNKWHANTVEYNVSKIVGNEWAAEMDPIIANPPPVEGRRGKYIMSPTHGAVQYTCEFGKGDIAIDLPDGMKYNDLIDDSWYRIVNIRTVTGVLAKIKVSYEGIASHSISSMTRMLNKYNVPRKFWVIQPWAFMGSTKIETGDIVL